MKEPGVKTINTCRFWRLHSIHLTTGIWKCLKELNKNLIGGDIFGAGGIYLKVGEGGGEYIFRTLWENTEIITASFQELKLSCNKNINIALQSGP